MQSDSLIALLGIVTVDTDYYRKVRRTLSVNANLPYKVSLLSDKNQTAS